MEKDTVSIYLAPYHYNGTTISGCEDFIFMCQLREALDVVMKKVLSPKQKEVLEKHFFFHEDIKAIAKKWNCSYQMVSKLEHDALEKLRMSKYAILTLSQFSEPLFGRIQPTEKEDKMPLLNSDISVLQEMTVNYEPVLIGDLMLL